MSECALDAAVKPALSELRARGLLQPEVLILLATGVGLLPARLTRSARLPLGKLAGTPPVWRDALLHAGMLGQTPVWLLEDAPGPPEQGTHERPGDPPWVRAFPIWLAAAAGAAVCVHGSAGMALLQEGGARAVPAGALALVSDHVNLSGRTPLIGLGESKLGPLFPDQSRLHHAGLRRSARQRGKQLGVPVVEAVAACTLGPALETAAERRFWARAGCDVAVAGLADPLLACAHAGLAVLALVCVSDAGQGIADVAGILQRAEMLAPALEELIGALGPELGKAARAQGVEEA